MTKEEFIKKCAIKENDCWYWKGRNINGNPVTNNNESATRVSYKLFIGPLVKKYVLRTCRSKICVNPKHLVNMSFTSLSNRKCEFCKSYLNAEQDIEDTVCQECDNELIALIKREAEEQALRVSHRKCRKCSNGLPISRYYLCFSCKPIMDSEDILFERIDTHWVDEEVDNKQGFKRCYDCSKWKLLDNFGFHKKGTKSILNYCKDCAENKKARYYKCKSELKSTTINATLTA